MDEFERLLEEYQNVHVNSVSRALRAHVAALRERAERAEAKLERVREVSEKAPPACDCRCHWNGACCEECAQCDINVSYMNGVIDANAAIREALGDE